MGFQLPISWCTISAINSMGMIIFHIAILLKDSVDLDGKWKFGGDVPLPHPQIPFHGSKVTCFGFFFNYHVRSKACSEKVPQQRFAFRGDTGREEVKDLKKVGLKNQL